MPEITRTARACSGTAIDAMRVAVDATPLALTSGGLARYTSELVLTLTAQFPGDQMILVSGELGSQRQDQFRGVPRESPRGERERSGIDRHAHGVNRRSGTRPRGSRNFGHST